MRLGVHAERLGCHAKRLGVHAERLGCHAMRLGCHAERLCRRSARLIDVPIADAPPARWVCADCAGDTESSAASLRHICAT
jgi:hypothetical protein